MPLFITPGRFTREYIKGGLAKPEDRHAAIRLAVLAANGSAANRISLRHASLRRKIAPNTLGIWDMSVYPLPCSSAGVWCAFPSPWSHPGGHCSVPRCKATSITSHTNGRKS
jgi:hypothetical protein